MTMKHTCTLQNNNKKNSIIVSRDYYNIKVKLP